MMARPLFADKDELNGKRDFCNGITVGLHDPRALAQRYDVTAITGSGCPL